MLTNLTMAVILPTVLGYALVTLILRPNRVPVTFKLSLAYGTGLAVVAFWMLLLSIFGVRLHALSTIPVFFGMTIILCAVLFVTRSSATTPLFPVNEKCKGFTERSMPARILTVLFYALLLIYFAANIYYVFWRSLNLPIYTWDAISTIAFKAKIFYYEQSLESLTKLPHKGYPLFVPFVEVWTAIALGQWHEQLIKTIFPVAFISFLGIAFHFLKYFTDRAWAALGCALLISANLFIIQGTVAYRDFFMTYYLCASIMLLLLWGRLRHHRGLFIVSALFIAAGSFVKVEGIAYLLIVGVVFVILAAIPKEISIKQKARDAFVFFPVAFSIFFLYYIYKYVAFSVGVVGSEPKMKITLDVDYMGRISKIIWAFFENMLLIGNWGIIWFVALLSLIHFFSKDKNRECALLLLSFVMFFGFYFLVALITPSFKWLATDVRMSTLGRVILHIYPLAPIFIVLSNYEALSFAPLNKERPAETQSIAKPYKKKKKKKKRKK